MRSLDARWSRARGSLACVGPTYRVEAIWLRFCAMPSDTHLARQDRGERGLRRTLGTRPAYIQGRRADDEATYRLFGVFSSAVRVPGPVYSSGLQPACCVQRRPAAGALAAGADSRERGLPGGAGRWAFRGHGTGWAHAACGKGRLNFLYSHSLTLSFSSSHWSFVVERQPAWYQRIFTLTADAVFAFFRSDAFVHASALAYYTIFSIVPLLLFIALAGTVHNAEQIQYRIVVSVARRARRGWRWARV